MSYQFNINDDIDLLAEADQKQNAYAHFDETTLFANDPESTPLPSPRAIQNSNRIPTHTRGLKNIEESDTSEEEEEEEEKRPNVDYIELNQSTGEPVQPDEDQGEDAVSPPSSYGGSSISPEEELKRKKVFLQKLKRFEKKGFPASRRYTLNSNLDEIQAEYESIRRELNLNATVRTMKKGLGVTTFLMETLNNRYDPVNAKLDGWSSQVQQDLDSGDYDEVCEELYDKYANRVNMPPEVRLFSMLGTSALQFHIAQLVVQRTIDTSTTDAILRENPQLRTDIMSAVNKNQQARMEQMQKQMMDPQNIEDLMQEVENERIS